MTPSAAKRGRNPAFPYVPIVIRADGSTHNTNTKHAYATHAEAVAYAQRWIDAATAHAAQQAAAYVARRTPTHA